MVDTTITNPGDFGGVDASQDAKFSSLQNQANPADFGGKPMSPSQIAGAYGMPTDENYKATREGDFPEGFAQDIYRNAPAVVKKYYDDSANEYETLNKALGQKFNASLFFGDSPKDITAAWDVNRSNLMSDKKQKFLEHYPDGDIRAVPYDGKTIIVARKTPTDNWNKIGESVLEKILSGSVDEATAGSIVGETLGGRALPFIGKPLGAAVGAVAGDMLKTGIEKVRGYDKEESYVHPEMVPMALASAAFSWYGNGGIGQVGKGFFSQGEYPKSVLDAAKFAKEENLPDISFGQASTNPIISSWYKQAASLDNETRTAAIQSNLAAVDKLKGLIAQSGPSAIDSKSLNNILTMARYNVGKIISSMKSKEITAKEGMDFLDQGIKNWSDLMEGPNGYFDKLYDKVWSLTDDVSFDLSGAQKYAKDNFSEGTIGKGKPLTVPSPVLGPDGKSVGTMTHIPDVKITANPKGELEDAINTLMSLDPTVTKYNSINGNTYQSFQQIKDLRKRFGDLTQSSDPSIAGPAKAMYEKLIDTIENGTSISGNPAVADEAINAFKTASSEYKQYKRLLEMRPIAKLDNLNGGNYVNIVNGLTAPGNYEALKLIGDIIPGGQDKLRSMFITKLLAGDRNAEGWENTISKELNKFSAANDPHTLSYLLKPGEEAQLRAYGKARDALEDSILPKLVQDDREASGAAWDALTRNKPDDIKQFLDLAGGATSKEGMAMRSGVLQRMLEASSGKLDNFDVINYDEFKKQLSSRKEVLKELFSDDELKYLEGLDNYVSVVKLNVGSGTSMQTANTAASMAKLPAKAGAEIAKGNVEKAMAIAGRTFILPVSLKLGGRALLNNALDFKSSAGRYAKKTALQFASKAVGTAIGQRPIVNDVPENADAAEFKYPGSMPDFATGAFK